MARRGFDLHSYLAGAHVVAEPGPGRYPQRCIELPRLPAQRTASCLSHEVRRAAQELVRAIFFMRRGGGDAERAEIVASSRGEPGGPDITGKLADHSSLLSQENTNFFCGLGVSAASAHKMCRSRTGSCAAGLPRSRGRHNRPMNACESWRGLGPAVLPPTTGTEGHGARVGGDGWPGEVRPRQDASCRSAESRPRLQPHLWQEVRASQVSRRARASLAA